MLGLCYFTTMKKTITVFIVNIVAVLSPYLFAIYVDDLEKLCQYKRGVYIILYADDILLIAPSVSELNSVLVNNL